MRFPKMVSVVAFVAACGGSPPRTEASAPDPENQPYPRDRPVDPCGNRNRVDIAMACWDRGAESEQDCKLIIDGKRAELTSVDAACVSSLLETCNLGCSLARSPNETRDHFHMLMTSPPP